MTTLTSPGVSVTVTDESFYASASEGTVPLFIIGTHSYKTQPSGSGVADGTLPENAGKLYGITSQRELLQTFGNPLFYSRGGTSVHAYELNEFGLHAAYQYLGVKNNAYVVRGNVDFGQLAPSATAPVGEPVSGTYWLDTGNTQWGVFESNGNANLAQAWLAKTVLALEAKADLVENITGSAGVADAAVDIMVVSSGNLVINSTSVAIPSNATLQGVVNAINTAAIPSVTARTSKIAGKFYLKMDAVNGAALAVGTSSGSVLTALGLIVTPDDASLTRPSPSIGVAGDYAIVVTDTSNSIYQKIKAEGVSLLADAGTVAEWYLIGSPGWKAATPTRIIGSADLSAAVFNTAHTLSIGVTSSSLTTVALSGVSTFADLVTAINLAITNEASNHPNKVLLASAPVNKLQINNLSGTGIHIAGSAGLLTTLGITAQTIIGNKLTYAFHYEVPENSATGDVWIKTTPFNLGADWKVKVYNGNLDVWVDVPARQFVDDAQANTVLGTDKIVGSLYVKVNTSGQVNDAIATQALRLWNGDAWEDLVYEAGVNAPVSVPDAGTLWFNNVLTVDVMVAASGIWTGYKTRFPNTDPRGVILSATRPRTQTDGTPLVDEDLWLDTSDLENYPRMARWNNSTLSWGIITADETLPGGLLFTDARYSTNGELDGPRTVAELLVSDYVDPDAPDARLYPEGVLLFNTRASTNNVKKWEPEYFLDGGYDPETDYTVDTYSVGLANFQPVESAGRWVSVSGADANGKTFFGRKAQRQMIVQSLAATLAGNEDIRAETLNFNLIASPGYPELIDEMVTLNVDKKYTAFVVGDSPARLAPKTQSLIDWAQNRKSAPSNGEDGLTTADAYVGIYYPWGMGKNVDGTEIMIPPSTMALRTIAYNDTVGYPWMAPAGYNRGLVSNATNVGYLETDGTFRGVMLSDGLRGVLQANNINPIAFMPNRGLTVFGQKTRSPVDSAMNRVNVARLINYLRFNLDNLARPFLFENNNEHTRNSVEVAFSRFMGDLVGLRALYDFIVVCDESNNTALRIDRNEMWIDIAIQPEKTVEFIYIPVRIVNTGADLQSLYNPGNN
jgi:hypothetical protein